jgi:hypothetical protein
MELRAQVERSRRIESLPSRNSAIHRELEESLG